MVAPDLVGENRGPRSRAIVCSTENSLQYSSAPRTPKASRLSGGRARTATDAAASAAGSGLGTTVDPGRRRPERLGQVPEVGDHRDPVGQPGHHARPPGADAVRVRLEQEVAGPQVSGHSGRGQFPGPDHPPGQFRIGCDNIDLIPLGSPADEQDTSPRVGP